MVATVIRGGQPVDIPSPAEIRNLVGLELREQARGVKWMRFPQLRGTPAASALSLGVAQGQIIGPSQGYIWSVNRLVISGLAASDIVNFYYTDNTHGAPWWQLNGNSFGVTFDQGTFLLRAGENLNVANSGTITATGTIVVDWDGWEIPAERQARLVAGG